MLKWTVSSIQWWDIAISITWPLSRATQQTYPDTQEYRNTLLYKYTQLLYVIVLVALFKSELL